MYPECKEFKYRNFNLRLLHIQNGQIHVYCNLDLRYRVMQHLRELINRPLTLVWHLAYNSKSINKITPPLTSPPPACKESVYSIVGQCD